MEIKQWRVDFLDYRTYQVMIARRSYVVWASDKNEAVQMCERADPELRKMSYLAVLISKQE